MTCRAKEFAKFYAGIAAHETLGHWWLGTWGRDLLPWRFGSFAFTPEYNMVLMAAWPAVLVLLVYYAWIRQPSATRCGCGTTVKGA